MRALSRRGKLALAALLALLAGCGFEPNRDEPLEPLPIYAHWWQLTEVCSGHADDYGRIRWYVLQPEDATHGMPEGYHLGGYTVGHDVWLQPDYRGVELIVRHEMLHVLIDDPNHTRPEWAACGIPTRG